MMEEIEKQMTKDGRLTLPLCDGKEPLEISSAQLRDIQKMFSVLLQTSRQRKKRGKYWSCFAVGVLSIGFMGIVVPALSGSPFIALFMSVALAVFSQYTIDETSKYILERLENERKK